LISAKDGTAMLFENINHESMSRLACQYRRIKHETAQSFWRSLSNPFEHGRDGNPFWFGHEIDRDFTLFPVTKIIGIGFCSSPF
jgi:hypothetical protein